MKGFTMIELSIVVIIIGILAAIAIPNFMKFQCRARFTEAGHTSDSADEICSEDSSKEPTGSVMAEQMAEALPEKPPWSIICQSPDGSSVRLYEAEDVTFYSTSEIVITRTSGRLVRTNWKCLAEFQ